jgi:hypothetical protein
VLAQIPISVPDAVPKKTWRKKKTHGKANACGLTAGPRQILDETPTMSDEGMICCCRNERCLRGR